MTDRNPGGRRLRQWLIEQIESGLYPGLLWENEERSMFRIPWKHAGKQDYNQEIDASIFKAWAVFKGKFKEGDKAEPATWKTRLRCALNKSPDFEEVTDRSQLDISEPYKVYRIVPEEEQKCKKTNSKTSSHSQCSWLHFPPKTCCSLLKTGKMSAAMSGSTPSEVTDMECSPSEIEELIKEVTVSTQIRCPSHSSLHFSHFLTLFPITSKNIQSKHECPLARAKIELRAPVPAVNVLAWLPCRAGALGSIPGLLSVWSFHLLPMFPWASSGRSGFLPQSKHILIGYMASEKTGPGVAFSQMMIAFYYGGKMVGNTLTTHSEGCRIALFQPPVSNELLYGPDSLQNIRFPPVELIENERQRHVTRKLFGHLERGVLVRSNREGIFIKRLCQSRVFWNGQCSPYGSSPGKLERDAVVRIFDTARFLAALQLYQEGQCSAPDPTVTLCFGEEFPDANSAKYKLIIVQITQMNCQQLLETVNARRSAYSNGGMEISDETQSDQMARIFQDLCSYNGAQRSCFRENLPITV
ncbi:IRF8 factor, partial [Atractosteus spatula]|nr:IRF8 factor [Atractosteus spatula]